MARTNADGHGMAKRVNRTLSAAKTTAVAVAAGALAASLLLLPRPAAADGVVVIDSPVQTVETNLQAEHPSLVIRFPTKVAGASCPLKHVAKIPMHGDGRDEALLKMAMSAMLNGHELSISVDQDQCQWGAAKVTNVAIKRRFVSK